MKLEINCFVAVNLGEDAQSEKNAVGFIKEVIKGDEDLFLVEIRYDENNPDWHREVMLRATDCRLLAKPSSEEKRYQIICRALLHLIQERERDSQTTLDEFNSH